MMYASAASNAVLPHPSNAQNQAPVLFAVPAPSSVGKGLLCLCRKVYWTNGPLVHCAYTPVNKDEAAELLRDPSAINILPNQGSNVLTVAANGAIIGIQQTVGYVTPQSPAITRRKLNTCSKERKKSPIVGSASAAPNEAKSPAMPQPTATPTSAQKVAHVTTSGAKSTATPLLPKINSVFTLAEAGIKSALPKEQAAGATTYKATAKATAKAVTIESTETFSSPMDLTKQRKDSNSSKVPPKAINQPNKPMSDSSKVQSKKLTKQTSDLLSDSSKVLPAEITKQTEELVSDASRVPLTEIAQQSNDLASDPQNLPPKELAKQLKEPMSNSEKIAPHELIKQSIPESMEVSPKHRRKQSNELMSDSNKVPPEEFTKQSNELVSESNQMPPSQSSKQSNVLSDVQNKVNGNQDDQTTHNVRNQGIKRKTYIANSNESVDKRRKVETSDGSLKVKFIWNKRLNVDGGERGKDITMSTLSEEVKINKPTTVPPESNTETEMDILTPSSEVVHIEFSWGRIAVHSPEEYRFACDTKNNLASINGKVPHLNPMKKLKRDDLKKLGCSPSCLLLQDLPSVSEKTKPSKKRAVNKTRQQRNQLEVSTLKQVPSLDAFTRHPDFDHIPTGNKVAYLKEILKVQRAALGIAV